MKLDERSKLKAKLEKSVSEVVVGKEPVEPALAVELLKVLVLMEVVEKLDNIALHLHRIG